MKTMYTVIATMKTKKTKSNQLTKGVVEQLVKKAREPQKAQP